MKILKFKHFLHIFIFIGIFKISQAQNEYFVDPHLEFSEWEGWGTSLCWWADILGGMSEDVIERVTDLFFKEDELNFKIVRYVIGGTTPRTNQASPYCTPNNHYRPGSESESFKWSPTEDYNWERDLRQRLILQKAIEKGADILEAFSNSPPDWLTVSGCSKGSPDSVLLKLRNNLHPSNASAFADYATEVIKYFHDNLNITFTSYAPFNEPSGLGGIGGWFGGFVSVPLDIATNQEGCNMHITTMEKVVKELNLAIEAKNMTYLKITTADETQVNEAIKTQNKFRSSGVAGMIEKVNVHGYWDNGLVVNKRGELYKMAKMDGHRLWMNEMGWHGTNDMEQALNVANRIVTDLKDLMPSAWLYWQAMEDINEWGLISVPYFTGTIDEIQINSGFYAMKQFSKYITKGFKLVHISSKTAVAAFHPVTRNLLIVTVNDASQERDEIFNLNIMESVGRLTAIRTSAGENNRDVTSQDFLQNSTIRYTSPAQSITTFIIENIVLEENLNNLILHSDFEDDSERNQWKVVKGESQGGIGNKNPWVGNYAGFLSGASKMTKTVWALNAERGSYHLTAWISNSYILTSLGVTVNGQIASSIAIPLGGTYRTFGFSFEAEYGDLITIVFQGRLANIDEVTLRIQSGLGDEFGISRETPTSPITDPPSTSNANYLNASNSLFFGLFIILFSIVL